jgi:hypothetical protein
MRRSGVRIPSAPPKPLVRGHARILKQEKGMASQHLVRLFRRRLSPERQQQHPVRRRPPGPGSRWIRRLEHVPRRLRWPVDRPRRYTNRMTTRPLETPPPLTLPDPLPRPLPEAVDLADPPPVIRSRTPAALTAADEDRIPPRSAPPAPSPPARSTPTCGPGGHAGAPAAASTPCPATRPPCAPTSPNAPPPAAAPTAPRGRQPGGLSMST